MKSQIMRALFALLIILVCFARVWEIAPINEGFNPGKGMVFLLDAIMLSPILVLLSSYFWYEGFKSVRFRKTILTFGLFMITWPLLFFICSFCVNELKDWHGKGNIYYKSSSEEPGTGVPLSSDALENLLSDPNKK